MSDREFHCRECGLIVCWRTSKAGKRYLAQPFTWTGSEGRHIERNYYPAHKCEPDPERLASVARREAEGIALAIANGRIIKGVRAQVHKGRKFPIGLTGKVFWVADAPDGYGVVKAGMTTDDGDKIFINIDNLVVADQQ